MTIRLPEEARAILGALRAGGFEAYAVGGCVRDSLLGRPVHDWDIATSAAPEEMKRCLSSFRLLETGLKHGTLTALVGDVPLEVTTYRVDGPYSDRRRPDSVKFVRSLREDLARRDFTINAMAYSENEGLVDLFGGREDLENRVIRCVGKPEERFSEDALRLLRALRFASAFGFAIEQETARSLHALRALLKLIAPERVNAELTKLLAGTGASDVLRTYSDVATVFIPELAPMIGFEQHNPYHIYDVWEHTLKSVSAVPGEPILRLIMLLHDIGKPACFTRDEKGIGHFYGHQAVSASMAVTILRRLRYDGATVETVTALVRNHDARVQPTPKSVRKLLRRIGEARFELLMTVREADCRAQNPAYLERELAELGKVREVYRTVLAEGQCYSLAGLKIGGRDLLTLGYPQGPRLGGTLERLLDGVIAGETANERGALLREAEKLLRDGSSGADREKVNKKAP